MDRVIRRNMCGIAGLTKLPAGSIDLVLTDVPSGRTRAHFDKCPDWDAFFAACWCALKPSGALVLFADSLFLAGQLAAYPHYRYERVWHKSMSTGFFLAKKRPLRSHEYILTFWRSQPTYNAQMSQGRTPVHAASRGRSHGVNYGPPSGVTHSRAGATDRYPGSILAAASVGTTAKSRTHQQQKPVPLLRTLVRTYTNPGDLVADPFAGSGSTIEAAWAEKRQGIGWDLYFPKAETHPAEQGTHNGKAN